jgi:TetR/AcrR family transcriptional regulator, lmrAB and yxaGH operons repressor
MDGKTVSRAPLDEKPGQSATSRDAARERPIMSIGRVFRHYGYGAASLSILSRETGLGRSSLYHFFPGGKEDMAMAVLDLAERFVRDDLMRRLSATGSRQAGVEMFVAKLRDYYEGGAVGCLYGTLTLHDCPPEIGARVAALTEQWIAAIADYLVEHGDGEAQTHAERIVRLIQGGLVVALATRDPQRFEASLDDIRPLLAGLT